MSVATVRWVRREPPLSACGVAAVGPAATVLLLHLETRLLADSQAEPGARASTLSGIWGRSEPGLVVVLTGENPDLPWVEGLTYLGRDPQAPMLLLPTLERPDVPLEIYAAALRARTDTDGLLACLSGGNILVSLLAARPLGVAELRAARLGGA